MTKLTLHVAGAALLFGVAGCAGYFDLDGAEVRYTDEPAGYDHHTRYDHEGVAVWEVDGHYYRRYHGRWVMYRERPEGLHEEMHEDSREVHR